jgi:hypothetical protein
MGHTQVIVSCLLRIGKHLRQDDGAESPSGRV